MLKRALKIAGIAALVLPWFVVPCGCNTTEPVIWSWPHHKRRLRVMVDDLHQVHMDFDRIIFDMEEYPIEVEY